MNLKQIAKTFLSITNPKLETEISYRFSFNKKLDLKNPKTINEKLLWLKLNTYNNNDVVTNCIDKYKIREYLHSKGLDELLPKLYGVYDSADDIDWESLPNSFVIKCNHGCGYNVLVKDKKTFNKNAAVEQLNAWMKEDYWKLSAEIQYKYIKKKIIIEEFLEDLVCYKFFCFNGVPKILYMSTDVWNGDVFEKDKYIDYYDMNFNRIECKLKGHDNSSVKPQIPVTFDEMKRLSKILSADFPFVRVDLYESKEKVYISELTFLPTAGFMHLTPESVLDEWGTWLNIE